MAATRLPAPGRGACSGASRWHGVTSGIHPEAARSQHVDDAVDHPPPVVHLRTPCGLCGRSVASHHHRRSSRQNAPGHPRPPAGVRPARSQQPRTIDIDLPGEPAADRGRKVSRSHPAGAGRAAARSRGSGTRRMRQAEPNSCHYLEMRHVARRRSALGVRGAAGSSGRG